MGPSGSGKSTLLQGAAGIDRPTSGTVEIGGVPLTGLSERRTDRRARYPIGSEVATMLRELADRNRQTIVLVARDPAASACADRVVRLVDGRVAAC